MCQTYSRCWNCGGEPGRIVLTYNILLLAEEGRKQQMKPGFGGVGLLSPGTPQGRRRVSSSKPTRATKQDTISKLKKKVEGGLGYSQWQRT